MSGLLSSLANSSGALRVHSKGLEVAGKNLANINNRGYAKQRVEIGDRGSIDTGIATESMGVEALGLRQNRDALLDKGVMRELTSTSALEAAKKVLQSAETALGQFLDRTKDSTSIQNAPGSNGGGISDALGDFFNAWESFSVKPNDVGVKQLLIQKAQILAEKFNSTDERLATVQSDVDAQIDTDLIEVNDILKNLAELNQAIGKAENVKPYSAVDLRDQRQAKLEELSKYFDVSFSNIPDGNGQIEVTARAVDGSSTILVAGSAVPNDATVTIDNTTGNFSFGGIEMDFSRGSLGAQVQARNGDVKAVRDQIADLASQLKTSVNSAYGRAFFAASTNDIPVTVDPSVTVSSLSATLTTNQGANEAALAVARLANQVFSTQAANKIDGTFIASFNSTVSQLGQTLNTTNIRLEDQELSQEMAISNRDQYSGVSQDEEMTDLMKFQRSFQASARHINVLDTLLEQVVNRLGVG
jgi:flagellar hook-associated protein 1 FlgK